MRKVFFFLGLVIGLITLMSSQCNNEDPDNPDCNGVVSASATGFIDGNYCFDLVNAYTYEADQSVVFFAGSSDESAVGFDIRLNAVNGSVSTGTFNCGVGEPGFVELIIEWGDNNDFYKSKSGTLTITQVDANNLKGSFNVQAVGYYNNETINFSGTIDK